ncbi:MAG TPA: DUF4384 domain-containing protein, partial [Pyrinomonadaceae bacterium]|nr:DUF4384 domain-containing protein [Pyrinomonadaceae bacterium]
VFYEMILGRRCFSGNTLHELRREHVSTTPRPLREVARDVPRGFSDAIERATAKDRGDRQATANALANELRAGLETPSSADTASTATDLTETVAINNGLETNSDVNAPTIITIDASETSAPAVRPSAASDATVYEPAKPSPPSPPMPAATVAESAPMPSSVTVPQVAKPAPPVVTTEAPPPKSKAGLFIALGVALVLILVVGVGGFLLWNSSRSTTTGTNTSNTNSSTEVVNAPTEISRYWLELEPPEGATTRVAGLVPLASGQSFKFHFTFNEDGYVYIFGPGDDNQPTAFLTTRPLAQTGVRSNQVTRGVEFSFPSGSGNNLTLDKNPGTDNFTVIFARTQLPGPSFLNEPVTGKPLSASQQADLKAFIAKYQEQRPVTELDESNARAPFVKVKAKPDPSGNPIVFDIRIQHN